MFGKKIERDHKIIIKSGPDKGRTFLVSKKAIVGRDKDIDVDLNDLQVSRHHVEVTLKKGIINIKDLGSSNGTIVDGKNIKEVQISSGETVTIGQTRFVVLSLNEDRPIDDSGKTEPVVVTKELLPKDMTMIHYKSSEVDHTYEKERLIKLLSLSNKIYAILDLREIANVLMDCIFDIFPSTEKVVFFLYDSQGNRIPYAYKVKDEESSQIKISQTILDKIHEKKSAILSSNVSGDLEYKFSESIILDKITSFMCAPMYINDKPVGVFYVHTTKLQGCFTEEDLRFFLVICNQIAMSIYNARLYSDLSDLAGYNANILSSISCGIIVIDNEGLIKTFNKTAEDIFHLNKEEVTGKIISDKNELNVIVRACAKVMKSDDSSGRIEIDFYDELEAQTKTLAVWTSFLKGHDQNIKGIIAFFDDITEVIKLNQLLQRSERLAALGEMAAGVAHEIRNPLNSIRGFAQLFSEGMVTQDKTKDSADIIIREVDRLNGLVVDLLDFGREQKIAKKEVDIVAFINDTITYVKQGRKDDEIKWESDFSSSAVKVSIDTDKIKQVLINLYHNALDALKDKKDGVIKSSIVLSSDKPDMLLLKIEDNGSGIPENVKKKIFNPFYSTKSRGSGLGLSICQRIIEGHGGEIDLSSKENVGTVFSISLPIS